MNNKLKIVLDTNVLLVSISERSKYHWIYRRILHGDFILCITNEILNEYLEIISEKFDSHTAHDVVASLVALETVLKISVYFNWALIKDDEDDNKFVDCAVSSNADYIVTHDKHFTVLKDVEFPRVKTLTIPEFGILLKEYL